MVEAAAVPAAGGPLLVLVLRRQPPGQGSVRRTPERVIPGGGRPLLPSAHVHAVLFVCTCLHFVYTQTRQRVDLESKFSPRLQ